jgi:hypothetical protein
VTSEQGDQQGGDLSITVSGEPHYVHRCHCDYCQRRTGNVFQVSCWYPEDQIVSRRGDFQVYHGHPNLESAFSPVGQRPPEQVVDYKFCRRCGSTVYWEIPLPAGAFGAGEVVVTGIAVGCFYDASFPKPVEDHYVRDRHPWVAPLEGVPAFERLPPARDIREPT